MGALEERTDRRGNGSLRFTSVSVEDAEGNPIGRMASGDDIRVVLHYRTADGEPLHGVRVHLGFDDELGTRLVVCDTENCGREGEYPSL